MQTPTHKATFILRLWTDGDSENFNAWRGTAEHIGSGQSQRFQTLDEIIAWLRQELQETKKQLDTSRPTSLSG